jgi:hypothetical protein
VYAQEGLARFWRGVGANALRAIPESAIRFWIYDFVKQAVGVDD